ncbi:MAG TPA: hypothetical protein VGH89_27650 [Pseudonocardia sp.]
MPALWPIEEHVPGWCVPGPRAVQEAWDALARRLHRGMAPRDQGVFDVLSWIGHGDTAPLSWIVGQRMADVRAESWLALCLAAGAPPPPARDWERLGVAPRAVHPEVVALVADREFPFGVWRTCAWLLGVNEDWPVYTSWHRASGLANPWPHLLVPTRQRDAAWRFADSAAREQAQAQAWRWWAHIRHRADATDTGGAGTVGAVAAEPGGERDRSDR